MVSKLFIAAASLYWGIQNNGEPQRILIDHFTSGYVMGIKGEDIHLPEDSVSDVNEKVIVAVLDTGIDFSHPSLKKVIAGKGYNFTANNEDTSDQHGHGTHISGIIALQATQNALILPVKVVQTGPNAPIRPQDMEPGAGTALTENVAKGVVYAINNGAKVINLSLAWPASIRSKTMDEAMKLAESKGVVVVASAANDGTSANLYPCIYSNVICVGAHGPDGSFTYFSNHGSMVDLLAPGIAILSTWPMTKTPVTYAGQIGYEFRNGTSMAAPYVAGAAAELISRGYSANETKNRLMLGTRTTKAATLYHSSVAGNYTVNHPHEIKTSRFGNLDISRALAVKPRSLILPTKKSRIEINWNGSDRLVSVRVKFKNNWIKNLKTSITIANQKFELNSIKENEEFDLALQFEISTQTESTFDEQATIETIEIDGTETKIKIPVTFTINRIITRSTLPSNSEIIPLTTSSPGNYDSIRSIIKSDRSTDLEYFLIRNAEIAITRNGITIGTGNLQLNDSEKILNLYRLDENRYALISTLVVKGESRPRFKIRKFDSKMNQLQEFSIGTETTVLNENFIWKNTIHGDSLVWVSIGYTPESEKPPFDPWNPKATDIKMPRIYQAWDSEIHSIKLEDDELPLQILPNDQVLIVKGTSYFSQYFMIDLNKNKTVISSNDYRMLIGLDGSNKLLNLDGSDTNTILMSGASTPGNMRTTGIDSSIAKTNTDFILRRDGTLDSLIQVSGAYTDGNKSFYYAQTHFDLKFFRSDSNQTHSTSLNRYSYIPSMIFAKSFFPIVSKDINQKGVPTVYIPASLTNANASEMIFADVDSGEISRPAIYHFKTGNDCNSLGNIIPATLNSTSKQVFICGSDLVLIPIIAP